MKFEDMGLLGLILGLQRGVGFPDFAHSVLKGIVDGSQPHMATLRKTLRAYLASNCNQRDAAKMLAVHPKTIAYRLEKIETTSRLSLRNHEHRIMFELPQGTRTRCYDTLCLTENKLSIISGL
ncbi:MAG: helix-turn-helix domain-containing protein [Rhizobiales bacterium]|nr:helix-turn-helix domain-containing protein [Hyphomicrobiales bacterium]